MVIAPIMKAPFHPSFFPFPPSMCPPAGRLHGSWVGQFTVMQSVSLFSSVSPNLGFGGRRPFLNFPTPISCSHIPIIGG